MPPSPPDGIAPAPGPVASRERFAFAATLAVALALRVWTSLTGYCTTFDTATVGLMALNILKGERPLFFYGQTYFGGLESWLAAGFFALFGPSEFTLSLAAIVFSLAWIAATWALFRELFGPVAAFAAALTLTLPGWDILWYSVGTYGGYPAAFFWGTTALWIAARIWNRALEGRALWIHAALLGLVAGLAVWTHMITAVYLLCAAGLVAARLARGRFAPRLLLPFGAAAALALVGALPVFLTPGALRGGEQVTRFEFDPGVMTDHFKALFRRPLRECLFAIWDEYAVARAALRILLAASAILFGIRLVRRDGPRAARLRWLLPLAFCGVFLALYVPHSMAALEVSRYVFPMWTILLAALVAAPLTSSAPLVRRAGIVLLAFWALYYGVTDICAVRLRAPHRAEYLRDRAEVVAHARAAGIRTAVMAGNPLFGHQGQVLSFAARGDIAFVSAYDERHLPSARRAELDPDAAIAVDHEGLPWLHAALKDLGADFRTADHPWIALVHDIRVLPRTGEALPPGRLRVRLADGTDASSMIDHARATAVGGPCGAGQGFVVELDRPARVDGLWLVAPDDTQDGLPSRYAIGASLDGVTWSVVRPPDLRTAVAWVAGNRAYIRGYLGMGEVRFPAVEARFLRVEVVSGRRHGEGWRLGELIVFGPGETPAAPVAVSEVRKIADLLRSRQASFVAADRWMSAQLAPTLDDRPPAPAVFQVPNPKFADTMTPHLIVPRVGTAIVVPRCVAGAAEAAIRAEYPADLAWDRTDTDHYAVLAFTRAPVGDGRPRLEYYANAVLRIPTPAQPRNGSTP